MKLNFKLCRIASLVVLAVLTAVPFATALANDQNTLAQLLKAPYRTKANVVRDVYRHPIETLTFFGVKETSTVVEILPGSRGYYLEILAPYLKAGAFISPPIATRTPRRGIWRIIRSSWRGSKKMNRFSPK